MKRADELQSLSREHHDSLSIAMRILRIAKSGSNDELADMVITVQKYYNDELEIHFHHEEQTLFATIFKQYPDLRPLSIQLLKEHGAIRLLCQRMSVENAAESLTEFADLLKSHTRLEERELFPKIEQCFSAEELALAHNYQYEPL